ncbi:MAG: MmgE/PrpD family protein [Candidatus Acetothermia bacterium]|jgi:2-methylcitrate dehydratase|nr:MmgE/PrpD family protein [Candidatus Acetothermia bacterium]MDH7505924.1 MmgE/PrpD family protein [Candidatus Acetothermia bacterium]
MSLSRELAKFALKLEYEAIPEPARREAKRFLLDSLGCALAALELPDMRAAYRYIRALGGRRQATIIGYGAKTNLPNAALMNSLLIRALDYNDIYWKQDPSHPSDIIPAALAPAEFRGLSGKELIVGIVLAYELEMRMCLAAHPGIREVGWHHASLTQFVSPVVAGRMLGLDEEQLVTAVGISGSSHFTLGGVVASRLTNMKNTADPLAVEAGVRAAMLAAEGYTGPEEVFEGKEGLFQVISNVKWDPQALLDGLGDRFMITECGYKAFPTEALTHQPITAALELAHEHRIEPHEVKEVLIQTTTRGADILSDPSKYRPTTKETADHSLPYCIAVAIAKGNVLPSDFEEKALKDPLVWELLPKIRVVADPEIDRLFPRVKRAVVTITMQDGRSFRREEDFAKGEPERPLSDEELLTKFRANSERALSRARQEKLIQATLALEEFPDIREYVPLLMRERP